MDAQTFAATTRRPRFRRASEPPAFADFTNDDVHIVRQLARHRFLRLDTHRRARRPLARPHQRSPFAALSMPVTSTGRARSSTTTRPPVHPHRLRARRPRRTAIDPTRRHRVRQRRMEPQEPQGRPPVHRTSIGDRRFLGRAATRHWYPSRRAIHPSQRHHRRFSRPKLAPHANRCRCA